MVGGGWRLDVVDPLRRNAPAASLTAREVVLSAGVLGTVELLLASRDRWRTLPWASPMLGQHVRTNSEAFTAVLQPAGGPDVSEGDGATISSDFHPDARTHVTNNRFPRSYGFMRWYLAPLVDGADRATRRRETLRGLVRDPRTATASIRGRTWHNRVTVLTVMQHDDNEIRLVLRRGPLGWGLRSRLAPGAPPIPTHLPQANAAARAVAGASGGTPYGTFFDPLLGIGATAHILGGAVIATTPADGVVDPEHRVFATPDGDVHEDLRVLDGSVVPANIGVNPALTITALAERAMALR
jgi:cholesterol oxidase